MSSSNTAAPASNTTITNNPDGTTTVTTDIVAVQTVTTATPIDATQTPITTQTTVSNDSCVNTVDPVTQVDATPPPSATDATVVDPNAAETVEQSTSAVTTTPTDAAVAPATVSTTTTPAISAPVAPVPTATPNSFPPSPTPVDFGGGGYAKEAIPTASNVNPTIQAALNDPSITPSGTVILGQVNDYMNAMHPKKAISSQDGANHQAAFFKTILRGINILDTDFNLVFSTILKVFHEEKESVFSHTHIFRFMENIPLAKAERALYMKIVNLFKVTADPKSRVLVSKQVDVNATLTGPSFTEKARQKVFAFFNIL